MITVWVLILVIHGKIVSVPNIHSEATCKQLAAQISHDFGASSFSCYPVKKAN